MTVAMTTNQPVSKILRIDDAYVAFCIDEASAYVISKIKSGEKPLNRCDNTETANLLKKGRW